MTEREALQQIIAIAQAALVTTTPPQPPAESCTQFVTRMYAAYLGRSPDSGGLAWWVGQCADGSKSRAEIEATFAAVYPPAPAPPTPVPPPPTGAADDLSDQAMHQFIANDGAVNRFVWRQSVQSSEQLTVIQVAAAAQTGWWSIDGAPWQSFTPTGSDFRFIPIDNVHVAAGTHTIDVKITGIAGGSGRFGIQNVGAGVGP